VARQAACKEGIDLTLNRKGRKRYVLVLPTEQGSKAFESLTRRSRELFGHVEMHRAGLALIRSDDNVMIVRCGLDQLDKLLVSIALTDPPMVALDMSASARRLRRRHSESE